MTREFFISQHAHLSGVRLSHRGDFCNVPFPTPAEAEAEAERVAKGRPYTIERKSFPALPTFEELDR